MTMTIARRNHLSVMLVFSILFSTFFLAATPPAEAGFFRAIAKIGRAVAVTAAAITGGVVGAVVGCVGGGPIGAIAGFTAGSFLAGTAMAGITSNAATSAVAGAAVGAINGMFGGPLGMIGGAIVGGVVGAAIGCVAEGCDNDCEPGNKGDKGDSGYINTPGQSEKSGVIAPAAAERTEIAESLPTEFPVDDSFLDDPVLPEIPEAETNPAEAGSTTYSDASEGTSEISIESLDLSNPEEMRISESVQFLVAKSSELDAQKDAVLADEAGSADYESALDEREEVADKLVERIIHEFENNNGKPGETYNQFKAEIENLPVEKRAAVRDIIESLKENAVLNQVNSVNANAYQNLAEELERM